MTKRVVFLELQIPPFRMVSVAVVDQKREWLFTFPKNILTKLNPFSRRSAAEKNLPLFPQSIWWRWHALLPPISVGTYSNLDKTCFHNPCSKAKTTSCLAPSQISGTPLPVGDASFGFNFTPATAFRWVSSIPSNFLIFNLFVTLSALPQKTPSPTSKQNTHAQTCTRAHYTIAGGSPGSVTRGGSREEFIKVEQIRTHSATVVFVVGFLSFYTQQPFRLPVIRMLMSPSEHSFHVWWSHLVWLKMKLK